MSTEDITDLSDIDDAIESGLATVIDESDDEERLVTIGDHYVYVDMDGYVYLIDSGYEPQDIDEARECQMTSIDDMSE